MTVIELFVIEVAVIVGIVLEGLLFERSFDAIKKRLVTQPSVSRVRTSA
jgi:uncharacterized membrane protein